MPSFLVNLNLNKNELQNARIQNLASNPSSPVEGQIYQNTADHNLYLWDGSGWVDLTVQGGGGSNATTGAPGYVQLAGDLGGAGTTATAPLISAGAIDAGKINANLKPSGTAAAGTESLRALGTTGSTALAGNTTLATIAVPAGPVSLNSQKITSLADGTAATDAVTKQQLDGMAAGLDAKQSVRAATTAAGTLASSFANASVIDGITLATNDRILIKNQAAPAENGIYTVNAAGAPTRATDADAWTELPGAYVWVEVGTVNADSGWVSTVDQGGTLNTTAVTFTQFSGLGQITAGAGLTQTGNTIDAVGTASRINVAANSIDIDAAYVGQTSITTLGTITTGTWTGTTIALANGGTGQTTAKTARETGLVASGYYSSATHGASTTITITQATHLLRGSRGLIVQVNDETSGAVEYADIVVASNGDVTVTFAVSVSANTKRVTIVG